VALPRQLLAVVAGLPKNDIIKALNIGACDPAMLLMCLAPTAMTNYALITSV
jgi:hypothetical protein